MTEIYVIMLGEEYSHTDVVEAFYKYEDAVLEAQKIADQNRMVLDFYKKGEADCWGDGLMYIQIEKINLK